MLIFFENDINWPDKILKFYKGSLVHHCYYSAKYSSLYKFLLPSQISLYSKTNIVIAKVIWY